MTQKLKTILKIVFPIILILSIIIVGYLILGNNNYKLTPVSSSKMQFKYLTYKDISTCIDERNRLVLINYNDNTITILSDTVTLGINAQISNFIYHDYIETKSQQNKK